MSYDQKKGRESNWVFDPDHKSLESKGQMKFDWGVLYIIRKTILRAKNYCPRIFKKELI
jgi:hypothetical protein